MHTTIFKIKLDLENHNQQFKIKKMDEKIEDFKSIKLEGEVICGHTLQDLVLQAGDLSNVKTLYIQIASPGGSVVEGLEIMQWMEMLSQSGVEIVTIITANAYSIASLIPLIADVRLISEHGEIMVHNPMIPSLDYANASELEEHARILRDLEEILQEIYEIFTGMNLETIKELMDAETYISPTDAKKLGFVDEIVKGVKKRPYSETVVNLNEKLEMSKLENILLRTAAVLKGDDSVMQKYYNQAGGSIEIYQQKSSEYQIGDKTNLKEGKVALNDGAVITVVDYKIEQVETPKEEEIKAAEFNEGAAPKEMTETITVQPLDPATGLPVGEPIEMPVVAPTEVAQIEEKPIVDSTEVEKKEVEQTEVEKTEEAPILNSTEEVPMEEMPKDATHSDTTKEDVIEKMIEEKITASYGEIKQTYTEKIEGLNKDIEDVAGAVENVANVTKSTKSTFVREPKAKTEINTSGLSIFERARMKSKSKK